jgi:hypothetical protein
MVWRPGAKPFLASEVRRILEEELQLSVRAMNLQYGSVVVEIAGEHSEASLLEKVSPRFQDRALLKVILPGGGEVPQWTPQP